MAPTGQRRAQSPQLTHLSEACGRSGSGLPAQYGRLPGTDTAACLQLSNFSCTAAAKASISCMSRASGRPAATVRSMECPAIKAPAATGTNACAVSRSHNSSRASSNARLPYTATATAGAPAPAMRRTASRAGAGTSREHRHSKYSGQFAVRLWYENVLVRQVENSGALASALPVRAPRAGRRRSG